MESEKDPEFIAGMIQYFLDDGYDYLYSDEFGHFYLDSFGQLIMFYYLPFIYSRL